METHGLLTPGFAVRQSSDQRLQFLAIAPATSHIAVCSGCARTWPRAASIESGNAMPRNLIAPLLARIDGCLVVEDDTIIRLDIEEILRGLGLTAIHGAGSVAAALEALATEPIRCAVLDFLLRDENSLAVAEALVARGIPLIFLTAYGEDVVLPAHLRHVRVLSKPFTTAMLADAIHKTVKPPEPAS
jgi:CheY-like chemotaxis protein